ncbi:MAG: 4Fe-4S dicluster domain-containing protein [Candidatus Electrothrix sp. AR3]|nr:4Fe-4S dicluster domain-containing protein [Candidatus Electrothrix sp. AR3]
MPRYAMVIDQSRCIGCMACVVACKRENDVLPEQYRTRVLELVSGEFPRLKTEMRSELCNHCDHAPCVSICPTGASHKQEDGTVQVDRKKCVGCKACLAACPYDARYINEEHGYADKCSFCQHRLLAGKKPACVATCIGGSRIFGDLDDPHSEIAKILRKHSHRVLKKAVGTKPNVYYINQFPKRS